MISDGLGSLFADALIEIVSKTSGFSLEVMSSEPDNYFSGIVGFMNLCGKGICAVFISASEVDMRTLCSFIIGVQKDKVTKEDIDDALCELVNMTVGNVKLRLGKVDYPILLSTPFIINGTDMSLVTKKRVNIISKSLGNGEILIKLKIIYAKT